MTAFLDFTLPSDAFVLGAALDADAASHIDLTQLVPVGDTLVPYVWAETDDDDAYVSAVTESPHVAQVEKLDSGAGRSLFSVTWKESVDGLLENVRCHDLVVQRAAAADGTWRFKLIAADRRVFGEFHAACREDGITLTINRVSSGTDRDSTMYGLTEKQREALLYVYESGYYDLGTNVGLSEISEDLGISQQALSTRLKRGVRALVENTIAVREPEL